MSKREIFIALSAADNHPRGNIWKITAKKTDFYLDFDGKHGGGFHLSMHGPNETFEGHRFHIKSDKQAVRKARAEGNFIEHDLGQGHQFDGVQVAEKAYRVARLRWNWDLQRPRFFQAALTRAAVPTLGSGRDGKMLTTALKPNSAWDMDIIVAYGEPFWPDSEDSERDKSRIEPLRNGSGMWLTATSYHRSHTLDPSPEGLSLPLPRPDETPQSILSCGPGPLGAKDMYWFVEGITSQELLANTAASRGRSFGGAHS
ncbi:hypothetical protein OHC50_01145 [Paenarthrobacter ilicis]|uniref:hypothetical protein n=1 Tax=Paenarthrobacter ilicis TaxID=43665 RepID=UPI0030082DD6